MFSSNNNYDYRFDNFLEETRTLIKKAKAALYFQLLFLRIDLWQDMKNLMEEYSDDGRRKWKVALLNTQQDDFYILQFTNKGNEDERHSFFWKIITEENKKVILSFSVEKFRFVRSCLDTFVEFANLERPWLGSTFLENLDDFIRTTFGANARLKFERIVYDLEPIAGEGKRGTNLSFVEPSNKEAIFKRKRTEYEQQNKFFYIRRANVLIELKSEVLQLSISDEGDIFFKKGELLLFVEMVNALKSLANFYRNAAERRFDISVKETFWEEGKKTEARIIQNLEVLKLSIDNPLTHNWYENLTNLFGKPYRHEEKLLSFVLMKGNPYFLVQVVDLEKGGSGVYLSATENSIRIAPSSSVTKASTVLKIVNVLQKYVDPNIAIAGV